MLETHRHLLIVNRPAIVDDLLVEDVLTEQRSKFVVDQEDSDLIESEKTSRRKAEKLLDLLPNKGYGAFQAFYETLINKYTHLAKLLEAGVSENQDVDTHLVKCQLILNNVAINEACVDQDPSLCAIYNAEGYCTPEYGDVMTHD